MRKLIAILLFTVLIASGFVALTDAQVPQKNFVLISWDATERTVFQSLLASGKLPFIATLNIIDASCNTEYGAQTVTRPQHAIMLSGNLADNTGIMDNNGGTLPAGLSIFERTPQEYFVVGAVAKNINVADMLGFTQSKIYYGQKGFDVFDNTINVIPLSRQKILTQVRAAVNHSPYVLFIHLADIDDAGHGFGVNSAAYKYAMRNCDSITAQIYSITQNANTLFIVTSDHGFGEDGDIYHHENSPNTFLACNHPLNTYESKMADVATTYYSYMQIQADTNGKNIVP